MTSSTTPKNNTNRNTTTNATGANDMTQNLSTITLADLADAIADAIIAKQGGTVAVETEKVTIPAKKTATAKSKAKAEPEPEVEEDEVEVEDDARAVRAAELAPKRITSLKKIAIELGFDPDDVTDADKATLIESILDDEFPDDDAADDEDEADEDDETDEPDEDEADDEDEDDEEDDEDEEGEWTREELEAMSLKELKALAKDAEFSTADLKGLDQDAIVDLLLDEGDDEDEDEEEDEDDEYTEDDLKAMSLKDLIALAGEWDIALTAAQKKSSAKIIKALLAE